jgi:RNA polymerase sigma factor (sigma-70 family)
MGDKLDPECARSLPNPLRRLLEADEGAEQERAWAEFLDSYSRLILYAARQIPRDHDVVMDRYAFVIEHLREKSCRRLRTFAADGRGKFTTWLMVVVRRLCLDHDRRKHGRISASVTGAPVAPRRLVEWVFDPAVLEQLPGTEGSADEDLEREQTVQQLQAAIARLSPRDQLLLTLRYQDDRSAREIASLMSLPTPFHVYRRLNRLHGDLRRALTLPGRPVGTAARAEPHPSAVQYR